MASKLSTDEVRRIAALARLALTDAEVDRFAGQLTAVLAYAGEIDRIDTTGVAPTSHPHLASSAERGDDPHEGLAREDALAQAPDASPGAGLFRVPRVL